MKILVVVEHSPKRRYLLDLHTEDLVREVRSLLERKEHSRAIVTALAKGRFEREVYDHELPEVKAGLILSEHNVSWDITGGVRGHTDDPM